MYSKHFIFTFIALCTSVAALAQFQLKAEVSSQSIGINQRIEVRFTMNDDGDDFRRPQFENFDIVGGPMQSLNRSWVNGKTSMEKSFSFFVQPKKKGNLVIGSASVIFEGKLYKSQPITIRVGDAVKEEPRQPPRNRDPFAAFFGDDEDDYYNRRQQQVPQNIGEGIHLVAKVSKTSAYLNEPITVEYGLYVSHRAGFNSLNVKSTPKYEGFWNHMMEQKQMQVTEAQLNGKNYRYIALQKAVILPQKEGVLQIDPLELEIDEQYFTGRTDVFGMPEIGIRKKVYSSGTKQIKVKPLPLDNQPAGFTGGVGSYTFSARINKNTVKANEPLELLLTVQGKGNLDLLTLPKPVVPDGLELYDPEKADRITKNMLSGMEGSKSEKYVIVPQYKGTYTIQPVLFSYFDIATKSYKTITSDPVTIEVTEGPELPTNASLKGDQETVSKLDIQPLERENTAGNTVFITEQGSFYAWWLAPLLLVPLVYVVRSQNEKRSEDTAGNRLKATTRLAKKYLSAAKDRIGHKEAFYEALERCLHNYLKAKLKIETADMSNDTISELLFHNQIEPADIQMFLNIKTTCEMARYAQMDIQTMQNDYDLAAQLISSIDKQLKK